MEVGEKLKILLGWLLSSNSKEYIIYLHEYTEAHESIWTLSIHFCLYYMCCYTKHFEILSAFLWDYLDYADKVWNKLDDVNVNKWKCLR